MQPRATVVITTKNRKDDLAIAIESCLRQTAAPEVLVIDDGSTDGTEEFVRQRFPQVRYDRVPESKGYIVQRNRGARLASAPIVVSIDDDAAFDSPHTIEQTLAEFDHPRIGAVAIPFIDVRKGDQVRQRDLSPSGRLVLASYIGTAHALRRDLFNQLGGYREVLLHQSEEEDFCVRMLDAGYVVRAGRADPIHHFESPKRDLTRLITNAAKNHVLFVWHNVPWPDFPLHLAGTTVQNLRTALRRSYLLAATRGLLRGYGLMFRGMLGAPELRRRPVTRYSFRLWRRLRRTPKDLQEIEPTLPPMVDPNARAPQSFRQRCIRVVCLRASHLGDRLGWEWLTYNPGVYFHFEWMGQHDAPRVADAILAEFPQAKSLADVGCGTGVFAAEFQRRGLRIGACEYSRHARRWARHHGLSIQPLDVSKAQAPLPGTPFDVAMSLEVAEHIPPPFSDNFVDFMTRTAPAIVLTAAPPGQGGQGHINERPKSYWIEMFAKRGFTFDQPAAERISEILTRSGASDYLAANLMVYFQAPPGTVDGGTAAVQAR